MKINNKVKDVWADKFVYWAACLLTLGLACIVRCTISEGIRMSFKK